LEIPETRQNPAQPGIVLERKTDFFTAGGGGGVAHETALFCLPLSGFHAGNYLRGKIDLFLINSNPLAPNQHQSITPSIIHFPIPHAFITVSEKGHGEKQQSNTIGLYPYAPHKSVREPVSVSRQ
jgi:hypothetical protein